MGSYENQPLRGLYAIGAGLGIAVMLPVHILQNLLPSFRAHKSWTLQQAVVTSLARSITYHQATIRIRTPLSLDPGNLGNRLEVIQPDSASLYTGILASKEEIKPVPISGIWYPDISSRSPNKNHPVILHIHGGCFVTLDARPIDCGYIAKTLGLISPRVFLTNYRLASNPGGTFPAALQDVLTAYLFLVKHEGSSRNIILSGDSAGSNLVLGLLRYIYSEEGKSLEIKPPRAALLWSAWLDIATVHHRPQSIDEHPNAKIDYFNSTLAGWGASVLGTAQDVESPYVTSIGHPFSVSETPLWYQIGDVEVLYDEIVKSTEEMGAVPGNTVQLHVEHGTVHDIILAGEALGFTSQVTNGAIKAKEFLDHIPSV